MILQRGVQLCKSLKPKQIRWDRHEYLLADEKIDGMRAVMFWSVSDNSWVAVSRNGKPVFNTEHIIQELNDSAPREYVLDGELFAGDFGTTLSYCRSQAKKPDASQKVFFIVFDMVRRKEWLTDDCQEDQQTRKETMRLRLCHMTTVVPMLGYRVESAEELTVLFNEVVEKGFEGLVVKDPTQPYSFKRGVGWFKYKPTKTDDFEIIGFEEGENRLTGSLGAIVVRLDGDVTGKVGTGFSDDQRAWIWNRREKLLGLFVEIEYEELVNSDKLRFPRYKGIRETVGGDHIVDTSYDELKGAMS